MSNSVLSIPYEELAERIRDKYGIEDIIYILGLSEVDLLDKFSNKVLDNLGHFDVLTDMDYGEVEWLV